MSDLYDNPDWAAKVFIRRRPREEEIRDLLNGLSMALGIEWDYTTLVNINSTNRTGPDTVIKGITQDGEKARFVAEAGKIIAPEGRYWKIYIGRRVYEGWDVYNEALYPLWQELKAEQDPDSKGLEERWE